MSITAGVPAVTAHHGDTAAAGGDNDVAGVKQSLDGGLLHDIHGLGGGDHLAIAAAGVLHHGIAPLGGNALGGLLVVEGAHGLGGMLEGGVILGHQGLGHHGGHALADAPGGQLVADGVLQVIADIALAHGAALGEGHVALDGAGLGGGGQAQVDHAHLGAVAVGHHYLVAGLDQVHNGTGGLGDQPELLLGGFAQGVAAQGDDDAFGHSAFTSPYQIKRG